MPRVLIIGGGLSGLTAGIYARDYGFETLILEKTANMGGECCGWWRNGYHIDNCIHWLTGTDPRQDLYGTYCHIGILGPGVKTIPMDPFFVADTPSGREFHLWQDREKLREEMLSFAPEDRKNIDRFIRGLEAYSGMQMFADMPMDCASPAYTLRVLWSMRKVIPFHVREARRTIHEYAATFKNRDLRHVLGCYFPKGYYAEALLDILGYASAGNTDLPAGGSQQMTDRVLARYEEAGGEYRTNAAVSRIIVEDGRARGVELKNGERMEADAVICTTPPDVLLEQLLESGYEDPYFDARMKARKDHPVFSNAVIYFACEGDPSGLPHTSILNCDALRVCRRTHRSFLFHHYGSEKSYAPEGSFVCQCLLMQYEADFDWWKERNDISPACYREAKRELAARVQERLETRYPQLKGRLRVIETLTPLSYHKRCGAYKGGYMSFVRTPKGGLEEHKGRIKGIEGLYVSGQWTICGGVPNAVSSGRFAVVRLCKDLGIKLLKD